ncbi:MAG: phenylacetate-CoA oxygenase subunit PaaC [Armatimonadetes bacterium]|nr:phenylacetate-CoA oxygenase subunit PaaC [Armatimonadota bacterium]
MREWLLRAADDELIIGHRHSEWTGFGPDIESDVALSSIAQEEIGHARLFYEMVCRVDGAGDPDRLAFGRPPGEFRHAVLVERPNADWGTSLLRLFLYEHFDRARLEVAAQSTYRPLADLAGALRREEKYHLLFGEAWVRRLGAATEESGERMRAALAAVWPDAMDLVEGTEADALLAQSGALPQTPEALRRAWTEGVAVVLAESRLPVPEVAPAAEGLRGRRGQHTVDLDALLGEMTSVRRLDPQARW